MLLAIASKPADAAPTFTVGADVSRFERSTVPAKPAPEVEPGQPGYVAPVEGPSVRVARGNSITVVPVGGK
jgi:pilus assembly protein CpaB